MTKKLKALKTEVKDFAASLDQAYVEADQKVKETKIDAIDALDVSNQIISRPKMIYQDMSGNISNAVEAVVNGVIVELKEIDQSSVDTIINGGSSYYGNGRVSDLRLHPNGSYERQIKDIKFYTGKVNGITLVLSTGSQLVTDSLIGCNGYIYDDFDSSINITAANKEKVLVLIGSSITAETLVVNGVSVLNNSAVKSNRVVTIDSSRISASSVRGAEYDATIISSAINDSRISGDNLTYIDKSCVTGLDLFGFHGVRLVKVNRTGIHGSMFAISSYSLPSAKVNINITNISLRDFRASFNIFGDDVKSGTINLNINRPIDYGYFCGIEPIPFIREGNGNLILSSGVLVTGTDYVSKPVVPDDKSDGYIAPAPQFGGGWASPPYSESSWASKSIRLDAKLGEIIFGHSYKNESQSQLHTSLIHGLSDQIRSRITLYATFAALNGVVRYN